jgi:hypothetical protein
MRNVQLLEVSPSFFYNKNKTLAILGSLWQGLTEGATSTVTWSSWRGGLFVLLVLGLWQGPGTQRVLEEVRVS